MKIVRYEQRDFRHITVQRLTGFAIDSY